VWVVVGLNEREGGTLYNTQAYYSPQGRLVARHRKLTPPTPSARSGAAATAAMYSSLTPA
jgi:predicted amidohydrolase